LSFAILKHISSRVAGLILLSLLPAAAQQSTVSPETVVLTVHGREYTRAEFEAVLKAQRENGGGGAIDVLSTAYGYARAETLAQEARRRGLDKQPDLQARLQMYEASLLNTALFNAILEEVQKDEPAVRKRYASSPHTAEERKLRHILIRHTKSFPAPGKLTPEQALAKAEALRKRIAAGENFAAVAQAESDDEKTKAKGGDLNFIRKPLLLPEVGAAAFQMNAGDVSQPIKTTEGYELVLVEKIAPPAFELIRKSLEYEMARERMQQIELTGIKLNPDYFGKDAKAH
jgi:parvulin-like peptidyl-prolyl isomerase